MKDLVTASLALDSAETPSELIGDVIGYEVSSHSCSSVTNVPLIAYLDALRQGVILGG